MCDSLQVYSPEWFDWLLTGSAYNGLYLIDNRYQFTSTAFISTSADYFYRSELFLSIFHCNSSFAIFKG